MASGGSVVVATAVVGFLSACVGSAHVGASCPHVTRDVRRWRRCRRGGAGRLVIERADSAHGRELPSRVEALVAADVKTAEPYFDSFTWAMVPA